jgi:hypothetical protein
MISVRREGRVGGVGEEQSIPSLRFRNDAVVALIDTQQPYRSQAALWWLMIR